MSRLARFSTLHRLLAFVGIEPGDVPNWICAQSGCTGFDLLDTLAIIPLVAGVFLSRVWDTWWPLLVAGLWVLSFMVYIHGPFETRERLARARRRRGECRWCGRAAVAPEPLCTECKGPVSTGF